MGKKPGHTKMITMLAHNYNARDLVKGDLFWAEDGHVVLLTALGRALDASQFESLAKPKPPRNRDPMMTRDMTASIDGPGLAATYERKTL
jgi:hypothetical protein